MPASRSRLLSLTEVSVIAHRGGSKLRPENTMAAFDHAASLDVDGIECDVHLSSDGEPVVIHDDTLDRTTDATGPVSALTADELGRVDAGCRFGVDAGAPWLGRAGGVPRLAEVLARHAALPFIVEIKGDRPEVARRTLDVIRAAGAEGRVIAGGFSDEVLREIRRAAPALPTSASRNEVRSAIARAHFWLTPRHAGYGLLQVPLRFNGERVLRRSLVRAARRARLPVHAWIIDDPDDIRRLLRWGVTGIISDRPDVAKQVLTQVIDHRPSAIGH